MLTSPSKANDMTLLHVYMSHSDAYRSRDLVIFILMTDKQTKSIALFLVHTCAEKAAKYLQQQGL
jgi:hypothetical protein